MIDKLRAFDFSSPPQTWPWWFLNSSSQHHDPGRHWRGAPASQSPPPPGPEDANPREVFNPCPKNKPGLDPLETQADVSNVDADRLSYQLFVGFVLEGDLPPSDQGDLGEEVPVQQLFEEQSSRLPGGSQDKTAFVLLPKVLLQAFHVNSHAVNDKPKTTQDGHRTIL